MAKTLRSRIAAVAVAAVGVALLQAAPSSAAELATTKLTLGSLTTVYPSGRTGVEVELTSSATTASTNAANDTVKMKAAFSSKPATSAISPTLTLTAGTNSSVSGGTATITAAMTAGSFTNTVKFTPDVTGTYSLVLWHDADNNGLVDTGEAVKTKSVTVVSGSDAVTATVTTYNTKAATGATGNGSLMVVALTNSAAGYASLGSLETVRVTPSGSGVIYKVNGNTTGAAAAAAVTLNRASFDNYGYAYLNVTDGSAESITVTIAGSIGSAVAGISSVTSLTFAAAAGAISGAITTTNTTGVYSATAQVLATTAGEWHTDLAKTTTVGFSAAATTGDVVAVTVTDVSGDITGIVNAAYTTYVTAASSKASFTAPAFAALAADENFTVGFGATVGFNFVTVKAKAAVPGTFTVDQNATLRMLTGASITLSGVVKDQFGIARANVAIPVSVNAGRNVAVVTQNTVSDSSGRVSFTYTDAPVGATAAAATSDTVRFAVPTVGNVDVTVNFVTTYNVGTVTLTTPTSLDTLVPTISDIDAGSAGAGNTPISVSVVVKDANGLVYAGIPVTWAVSGLTGAAVTSTKVTTYTDATGAASSTVYSTAAGTATVTVTAGGKSATGTINFAQTTATEARTIAATVSGSTVTAVVKDRYGNPIKGVYVYATRTGAGYFGTGASSTSAQTDVNGSVDFVIVGGAASVTVALGDNSAASVTYGQSADAAGKVGTTTITATSAGASLAPAGVNTATVSVANPVDPAQVEAAKATAAVAALATTITSIQTAISTLVASTTSTLTLMAAQIAKIMKKLGIK